MLFSRIRAVGMQRHFEVRSEDDITPSAYESHHIKRRFGSLSVHLRVFLNSLVWWQLICLSRVLHVEAEPERMESWHEDGLILELCQEVSGTWHDMQDSMFLRSLTLLEERRI